MTLKEIDASLPRGFHDAEIYSVLMDYAKRRMTMSVAVWLGREVDGKEVPFEAFRLGELVLEGVQFLAMDVPQPDYFDPTEEFLWVDLDTTSEWTLPVLERLPKECFASRFFVSDWNGFVYVAAKSASFAWKGEAYERWPKG